MALLRFQGSLLSSFCIGWSAVQDFGVSVGLVLHSILTCCLHLSNHLLQEVGVLACNLLMYLTFADGVWFCVMNRKSLLSAWIFTASSFPGLVIWTVWLVVGQTAVRFCRIYLSLRLTSFPHTFQRPQVMVTSEVLTIPVVGQIVYIPLAPVVPFFWLPSFATLSFTPSLNTSFSAVVLYSPHPSLALKNATPIVSIYRLIMSVPVVLRQTHFFLSLIIFLPVSRKIVLKWKILRPLFVPLVSKPLKPLMLY